MSSDNPKPQRLLICTSSPDKIVDLETRVLKAGFEVECVTLSDQAIQRLWQSQFCGIAIDLLLADQDGISFAREVRHQHPWLPVLVLNTEAGKGSEESTKSPDWFQSTTEQARLIFALKQASIRTSGQPTQILHIEENDAIASLVLNTVGGQISVFRARTLQEAQIALSLREYDITLVNSQRPILDAMAVRHLSPNTVPVDNSFATEPLLTVLENMRRYTDEHSPAYC